MKEEIKTILSIEGVEGLLFISPEGRVLISEIVRELPLNTQSDPLDGPALAEVLKDLHEAEVVFEKKRLYIKRADTGFLVVILDFKAPMAMVRLNSDLLIASMELSRKSRGLGRFFKRK